ncbi:MAG: saccharopine dehydrogenase family protein, partial [Woeseiaceae bacterium]
VMCCGFDSIPSDMGVYCLQEMAQQLHDQHCTEMTLLVRAMRGGASGGTFASMLNAIEEAQADKSVARILSDPYGLNPEGEREGPDTRDQTGARFDEIAGLWTAPFVMAGINTRVVRRSNALSGYAYGKQFRYRESTITGTGLRGRFKASFGGLLLKLFIIAAAIPFTRKHLVQRLLPKPGQGPSATERETGFFNMVLIGKLEDDSLMRLRITGDRDPGYGSTSKMLAECALCLAHDDLEAGGGCLTPSVAMGNTLLGRLQQNAGLTFVAE